MLPIIIIMQQKLSSNKNILDDYFLAIFQRAQQDLGIISFKVLLSTKKTFG
jgi:hypothetical protein